MSAQETLKRVRDVMDRCRRDSLDEDLSLDIRQEHSCVADALQEILDQAEPSQHQNNDLEIIRESHTVEFERFYCDYQGREDLDEVYSFHCDADGVVDQVTTDPTAWENYRKCVSGEHHVVSKGVRRETISVWMPSVGRCRCGALVELANLDNHPNRCVQCDRYYDEDGRWLVTHWRRVKS